MKLIFSYSLFLEYPALLADKIVQLYVEIYT
jgi:hypothetical protein